jgi:hypothetical protein
MLNRISSRLSVAAVLLAGMVITAVAATEALTSTKDQGVVSVQADPSLSDGRLILKVVAFNRTRNIASFGAEDIEIYTAAGKRVALLSLEQLVAEARGEGPAERNTGVEHNPTDYSGPTMSHNSAGEPDVGTYTGSQTPAGGVISPHTRSAASARKAKEDPAVEQYVATLQAAILRAQTVASGASAGGQVVTEKLKFRRKDDRTLRVVVTFNGITNSAWLRRRSKENHAPLTPPILSGDARHRTRASLGARARAFVRSDVGVTGCTVPRPGVVP